MKGITLAQRSHGHTLVELLVATAIISLLIAVLLPAGQRVRHAALVLSCPIAYLAADGQVWLCDVEGRHHVAVSSVPATDLWINWSPRGNRIVHDSYGQTVVLDPYSGASELYPALEQAYWIDGRTLQGSRYFGSHNELWRLDTLTRRMFVWKPLRELRLPHGQMYAQYSPQLTGGYLVSEADFIATPTFDIVVRDQDWGHVQTVWADPDNNYEDYNARVDYLGEKVAWTRGRASGCCQDKIVAIKSLNASPAQPPVLVDGGFGYVTMCDWIPDGRLLVNVTYEGVPRLAILDPQKNTLRVIPGTKPLMARDGCASWRRGGQ